MFKKSVYLFSAALLGLSLSPLSAFADEALETPAPVVTTEFVESSDNTQVSVAESENVPSAVENESVPFADSAPETAEPTVVEAQVPEEETVQSEQALTDTENQMTVAAPLAAPAPTTLTDDHDGKIADHDKAITDEDATISSDYNFMPKFDDLDDDDFVVNAGSATFTEDSRAFKFDLRTANPNEITVTFKNVGSYKGKVIDMKITVKNWTPFSSGSLYGQSLSIHKSNGITMSGIKDVQLGYSFLDNLTGNAATVSGFFNFTDIDLKQSIDVFDNNNVQNFFVAEGNILYYKTYAGYIKIGDISGRHSTDRDIENWLTYTYKNISNFDIRYNQDYETGAVFNYTYQAPVVIEETPPSIDPEEPIEEPQPNEVIAEPIEVPQPKQESKVVNLAAPVKKEEVNIINTAALPTTQTSLPQTNEQSSSALAVVGSLCLLLFSALFLNKKKTS
ncbi:hypothetical protein NRIC_32460 [Enterococcus florum]|uniref:Gram-positive cocci surface proteins LPxTG domain-containing protein n=1 Tax=Enterococcus florum TaxID=2480627 RepID=A0A4P5PB23_9ENTE|nr:LPXTG cell wall anchor domain-containing protein [Enterococcus florum]GCF95355.1 hypothetical protein NRIC_32460 [Enterococcus florum]